MPESSKVLVWDLPVRAFHWTLVLLFAVSWWSGETGGTALKYHFWSGYGVLSLVLFRLLWGLAGGEHARFRNFLRGPQRVWQTLRELPRPRPDPSLGHNPAGGWMVVALLVSLLVQTLSGFGANDDLFNEGPWYDHLSKALSDTLTGVHHVNFSILLGLVAVHIAAIAFHWRVKGENLVTPMVTGYKSALGSSARQVSPWRALALVAVACGVVAALVKM